MTDKFNSASRINNIVSKAPQYHPGELTYEVWAKIFDIVEERLTIKSTKVTFYLNLLNQEVLVTRERLKETNISENRYAPAMTDLEEAFSPHWLTQPWSQVQQYLNTATVTSLGWVVDLLPEEENIIAESDLVEISALLCELELLLETSSLPISLILVIKHLTALIREAIDKYPISGAKAIHSALTNCCGELVLVAEEIQNNPSEETNKLKKIIEKAILVVDSAERVQSAIGIGKSMYELLSKYL